MPSVKLSACIEMIFGNVPNFVDRIDKAAECGLPAFEFWGWGNKDMPAIRKRADDLGIFLAASCVESKGALVDPANTAAWVENAKPSIDMAVEFRIPTLIVTTGNEMEICRCEQHKAIVAGLKGLAPYAEEKGIMLVLEPLNILVDHGGYYLSTSKEGFEIVREVASPRVKLLFDVYHQQITEGNLIQNIRTDIDLIGHFHMADVPGRHEPGTGELNYKAVFAAIAGTDYEGFVGMEFAPTGDHTRAVLTTMRLAGTEAKRPIPTSYREAVSLLAAWHYAAEEPPHRIFLFPDSQQRTIRFVEETCLVPETGEFYPIGFGPTTDMPFATVVAQVTPGEWERIKNRDIALPEDWDLCGCEEVAK